MMSDRTPAELEELASASPGRRPRRRRTLAVVAALVVAAGVTAVLMSRNSAAEDVRVEDSTGRLVAEVPAGWGHGPGLVVADDLGKWQDLTADVNGVFLGVSERGDLTAGVNAVTHAGCHDDGARALHR